MLSWAAEVAQLDISAGLAIAVLAFIAVLPEYAVDLVFAFKAGGAVAAYGSDCRPPGYPGESPCSLALANMTGANRLLIGIGWSMVVFVAWYRSRARGERLHAVALERSHSIELAYLAVATAYSLTLPLKTTRHAARRRRAGRDLRRLHDPDRLGAGRGAAPGRARRATSGPSRTARGGPSSVVLFVFAATVILLVAEHFAEALVATGRDFHISEFLLVQWLAPLASEAPELLVAGLYAWRLNTNAGLGTLVSSKVNQWTLLVGTLPIVFAIASGSLRGLPVEPRQREELLLTAAQSVFAVATLASLSISLREAGLLFGLFFAQFVIGGLVPEAWHGVERIVVSVVYLLLAVVDHRPGPAAAAGAAARRLPDAARRAARGRERASRRLRRATPAVAQRVDLVGAQ